MPTALKSGRRRALRLKSTKSPFGPWSKWLALLGALLAVDALFYILVRGLEWLLIAVGFIILVLATTVLAAVRRRPPD